MTDRQWARQHHTLDAHHQCVPGVCYYTYTSVMLQPPHNTTALSHAPCTSFTQASQHAPTTTKKHTDTHDVKQASKHQTAPAHSSATKAVCNCLYSTHNTCLTHPRVPTCCRPPCTCICMQRCKPTQQRRIPVSTNATTAAAATACCPCRCFAAECCIY